jgi:predicted O-methyltransferase YrrM
MQKETARPRNLKIAGIDSPAGYDPTQVDDQSEFSAEIHRLFSRIRPRKLIETGTYHGNGTTRIIARAIKELEIEDSIFYSIEINPRNCGIAAENLKTAGLMDCVRIVNGLSIPRDRLPTLAEIREHTVDKVGDDDIFVDHQPSDRAELYYRETDFSGLPDDLLGRCLREFGGRPDFVLLDSGGHVGYLEFETLIDNLEAPTYIALDDIFHIKHHGSFKRMQSDPRFEIWVTSREKFGFCIARFNPKP